MSLLFLVAITVRLQFVWNSHFRMKTSSQYLRKKSPLIQLMLINGDDWEGRWYPKIFGLWKNWTAWIAQFSKYLTHPVDLSLRLQHNDLESLVEVFFLELGSELDPHHSQRRQQVRLDRLEKLWIKNKSQFKAWKVKIWREERFSDRQLWTR